MFGIFGAISSSSVEARIPWSITTTTTLHKDDVSYQDEQERIFIPAELFSCCRVTGSCLRMVVQAYALPLIMSVLRAGPLNDALHHPSVIGQIGAHTHRTARDRLQPKTK